jgi:hypothetical protein
MTCNTNESIINITQSADTVTGFSTVSQIARGSSKEYCQHICYVTALAAKTEVRILSTRLTSWAGLRHF